MAYGPIKDFLTVERSQEKDKTTLPVCINFDTKYDNVLLSLTEARELAQDILSMVQDIEAEQAKTEPATAKRDISI